MLVSSFVSFHGFSVHKGSSSIPSIGPKREPPCFNLRYTMIPIKIKNVVPDHTIKNQSDLLIKVWACPELMTENNPAQSLADNAFLDMPEPANVIGTIV
jgi:hypothetical protein